MICPVVYEGGERCDREATVTLAVRFNDMPEYVKGYGQMSFCAVHAQALLDDPNADVKTVE